MKLDDSLKTARVHSVMDNVGADDHHDAPENIEVSNTTQTIDPLPGGPGVWDISLPDEASLVMFTFRSVRTVQTAGAKGGTHGIATDGQLEPSTATLGGHATIASTGYNMIYSSPGGDFNLSDKIFSSTGLYIAMTGCYITGGAGSRVLRTTWTNYGGTVQTLDVRGEVAVLG